MTEQEQQDQDDIAFIQNGRVYQSKKHGRYGTTKDQEAYDKAKYNQSGKFYFKTRYYGISKEDFLALVAKQEGKCKICHAYLGDDLHVDHCHATNRIRGLLCQRCNTGLGAFKDNPGLLENARKYVWDFINSLYG